MREELILDTPHRQVVFTIPKMLRIFFKYKRPLLSSLCLCGKEALVQGQVVYQYGKHSAESEHMNYLEFIARITSHIPDKGQVMVRYYGIYSNAHRGKMRKAGVDPSHPPVITEETPFVPSKGWAEMIKKVYCLINIRSGPVSRIPASPEVSTGLQHLLRPDRSSCPDVCISAPAL